MATIEALYMTAPDMMRSGHRMRCDDFEVDPQGIMGDVKYGENEQPYVMLLVSQKSYDLIEEAELVVDKGVLMESIFVDEDLYHLKAGSVIEIADTIFEVKGPCEAYGYLYALDPQLPEILKGNRGLFISPVEYGHIRVGDTLKIVKEA